MHKLSDTWSRVLKKTIADEFIRTEDYENQRHRDVLHHHTNECLDRVAFSIPPTDYAHGSIRGKRCLTLTHPHEKVIDRVTAIHLKRHLKNPTYDRNQIISGLIALLPELGPAKVYRLDISSFFESVDRGMTIRQLRERCSLDCLTDKALRRYDDVCTTNGLQGLARGVALSSAIGDWLLSELDRIMRRASGVFYYARFVDDIVLLAANDSRLDPEQILNSHLNELPGNLVLNPNKRKVREVSGSRRRQRDRNTILDNSFDYLGYNFSCVDHQSPVRVEISSAKIKRIKSKLVSSYRDYLANGNFNDLLTKIRLLTGNTVLIRRGVKPRAMRTGIFYNYPALTDDTYSTYGGLTDLDTFARTLVLGTRSPLSRSLNQRLRPEQTRQLLRCSFVVGHRERIFVRISRGKAQRLIESWNNVD